MRHITDFATYSSRSTYDPLLEKKTAATNNHWLTDGVEHLDEEKFQSIIRERCTDYNPDYDQLYVIQHPDIPNGDRPKIEMALADPATFTPHTAPLEWGILPLLLEHLPTWEEYPSRRKCLLLTTDAMSTAPRKGTGIIAIPFDKAVIATTTKMHFDQSFPHLASFSLKPYQVEAGIVRAYAALTQKKATPTEWEELEKIIATIDAGRYEEAVGGIDLLKRWNDSKYRKLSLLEFLDSILNAKKNMFMRTPYGRAFADTRFTLSGFTEHECWTNSPCLLVREDIWQSSVARNPTK